MFEVKIKGFKTLEQAHEFMHWYENNGEQDFDLWLECQDGSPKDGCIVDIKETDFNELTVVLK